MKKRMIASLILAAITVTLSGCNNPKAASKGNFAKLLNQYVTDNPYEVGASMFGSNYCTIKLSLPYEAYITSSTSYGKKYEALKDAGILTSQVIDEKTDSWVGKTTVVKYDLSEKGRQLAKQEPGNNYSLPYCKVAFKEVKSFTEPADSFGAKVSQVAYTFVIEKVDDWVNHPDLLQEDPIVKDVVDSVGKPRNGHKTLVLTSEGWSTGRQ